MNRPRLVTVMRRVLIAGACFAALAIAGSACKQGEGDRCQLDDDCESGLVCNVATQQCASANSNGAIDATVPEFLPDDAAIDAAPDADAQ